MKNNHSIALLRYRLSGFTLIELLVVIAIIGILSALIIVSLTTSRLRAGDTDRKSKARSLSSAVEQYYLDHSSDPTPYPNGTDSSGSAASSGTGADIQNGTSTCQGYLQTALVTPNYLKTDSACVDVDSSNIHRYRYRASASPITYVIAWHMKYAGETPLADSSAKNGVYKSGSASPYQLIASSNAVINAGVNDTAAPNYFVVFGPQ